MTIRFLCFLIFLAIAKLSTAQILLSGQVVSASNKESIDFAAVHIKDRYLGTYTDDEGAFKLLVTELEPNDSLVFHALGYRDTTISIRSFTDGKVPKIELEAFSFAITEVTIEYKSPLDFIKNCLKRIPENMLSTSHIAEGFYRQIHQENGRFVRLIEAAMLIEFPAYKKSGTIQAKEKGSLLGLRRSYVYEENGYEHDNHLIDLFSENPLLYLLGSPLNPKAFSSYSFYFATENTKSETIEIGFDYRDPSDATFQYGSLWINAESYHLERIEIFSFPNPAIPDMEDWQFLNGRLMATYSNFQEGNFLQEITKHYNHLVWDEKIKDYRYTVEETFHWETIRIVKDKESLDSSLGQLPDLYNCASIPFDWESLEFKTSTIPEKLTKDLERFGIPLEEQFKRISPP